MWDTKRLQLVTKLLDYYTPFLSVGECLSRSWRRSYLSIQEASHPGLPEITLVLPVHIGEGVGGCYVWYSILAKPTECDCSQCVAAFPTCLWLSLRVCVRNAYACTSVAQLLERPWHGGCQTRLPSSCPSDLMCSQSLSGSFTHKEWAYVCDWEGVRGGRRVIADYCYSSRHFISREISISPPYWACFGTDLPSHTMFPLSTSDDQTAGPQMLLLSKKLVKAPWDDAFHFWHFPLPRDETGLLWSALDQEERNWAVVSALLASKQTVFQIWLGLIN